MFICYFTSNLQTMSNFRMTSLAVLVLWLCSDDDSTSIQQQFTVHLFSTSVWLQLSRRYVHELPSTNTANAKQRVWCWSLELQGSFTNSRWVYQRPSKWPDYIIYRPHNTRGVPLWPISESAQFKEPIAVLPWNTLHRTGSKHYEFLWGNISQTSGSDEHFDGSQEGNSTKLPGTPHPRPSKGNNMPLRLPKEPQKSARRNELSLTERKLHFVWH